MSEKLNQLNDEKMSLVLLWEERRILYEQCMDLQLFLRDTEQADSWMGKQGALLEAGADYLGDSLDSVEALIKKHDDFLKSLTAHEEKIKALDEFAQKLVESGHYAAEEIEIRRTAFLERRRKLMERAHERAALLRDAARYQQFTVDYDDTKFWIVEKLKISLDENYHELTNLSGKQQQHRNFEREISANEWRVQELVAKSEQLLLVSEADVQEGTQPETKGPSKREHYAAADIRAKAAEISSLWTAVREALATKAGRLEDALAEQAYNRAVEDVELWLGELEKALAGEDYGRDLNAVQRLLQKQTAVEAEVTARGAAVSELINRAQGFAEKGHFHAEPIAAKKNALVKRLNAIKVCFIFTF